MDPLRKTYLTTGVWHDKETGQPKSRLAEVSMGKNKVSGKEYAFAETERGTMIVDAFHPIGTILTFAMTPENPAQPAQQPDVRNLKISKHEA